MVIFIAILLLVAVAGNFADKPCMPRHIENQSVVCVCADDYCDTLHRAAPARGGYVTYTSSKSGLRFQKLSGWQQDVDNTINMERNVTIIKLNSKKTFQTMTGFGGAVTDSTAMNWKRLTPKLQKLFIESHFGEGGIGYSMVRVPIGGSDFSTHSYTYNELPENDTMLSNFALTAEDLDLKIPLIKAAMDVSATPIFVLGSCWSPPLWMKTNHKYYGRSCLKDEYFQTYADYHLKFIDEYAKRGVPVWGVTNSNEPFDGVSYVGIRLSSLGWTPETLGKWIAQNLGPTLRNSKYNSTKILAVDDQRFVIPLWFNYVIFAHPEALSYIDGVALHWYGDIFMPPSILSLVTDEYPDKFLLGTEASNGFLPTDEKVLLGSWERAEFYVKDIIEDMNAGFVGWLDWNMCLDNQGGPNYIQNFVDSPVIVTSANEFLKQPMHYGLGHFAKFVPRDSKRIETTQSGDAVSAVAFKTPLDTVVAVIFNGKDDWADLILLLGKKQINLSIEPRSFTTVEVNEENDTE